ncbi:MAG: UvrD-helicase domain-containing protein, partial [Calditrichia bacterium]
MNKVDLTPQQRKALDLKRNLIITAGAGSGKTTVLVERYLSILLNNPSASVHNILAITFTEKAAAEMKERIVEKIYKYFEEEPSLRARLFEIIKIIPDTQISTIHSFCRRILNEYALYGRYNPDLKLINSPELDNLLIRVFWDFFYSYNPGKENNSALHDFALRQIGIENLKRLFIQAYSQRAKIGAFLREYSQMTPEMLIRQWQQLKESYHRKLFQPFWDNSQITAHLNTLLSALQSGTGKTKNFLAAIRNYLD